MIQPRTVAKRAVEVAIDASGAGSLLRRRMAARDLVLAYHNIVPDGEVDPAASGHLGASNFAAQMSALATRADVVPITALTAPATGDRPRVAITFDDGYRGAFRHAVPVLTSLGLPATFFVCPGLMGSEPFWWDTPNLAVWPRRAEILVRLQGRGTRVREWIREQGLPPGDSSPDHRAATAQEVREFARQPGITLGAHTMSHPNLSTLEEAEVRSELVECRDRLASEFPSWVPWVAYPFGLANPMVERVAAESGFHGGFVLDGGWIPSAGARITGLPRLNIAAGLSIRGFRLRLAGLFAR
jgi:peptidoglycan/xylan/chitin deacetylase (PgdA/CDA1 family)